MTNSIVKTLFVNRANAINADIVKNATAILTECATFFDIIEDAHNAERMARKDENAKAGTDAIREAITTDGHFAWLYDAMGKPNKKGISKPIMSDHMRKIREGMLFLADENNADLFTTWAESDSAKKSGVCDFANIKKAIKPKAEKTESIASDASESDASEDAEADASDNKRTLQEFMSWFYNQARIEFGMDSLDIAEYMESAEGMKIADNHVKVA
jgi:DNA-binding transcriptional regulator GbsR (MarR family)